MSFGKNKSSQRLDTRIRAEHLGNVTRAQVIANSPYVQAGLYDHYDLFEYRNESG